MVASFAAVELRSVASLQADAPACEAVEPTPPAQAPAAEAVVPEPPGTTENPLKQCSRLHRPRPRPGARGRIQPERCAVGPRLATSHWEPVVSPARTAPKLSSNRKRRLAPSVEVVGQVAATGKAASPAGQKARAAD